MELRKDPITQSWVIQEDDETNGLTPGGGVCLLCPGHEPPGLITTYEYPYRVEPPQIRVISHFRPLYRIEGDEQRRAEGIYDKMRSLGAHEIVIESPDHRLHFSQESDENAAHIVGAYVARIADLKKDRRFRHITVFRNQGRLAGQDFEHPHSQITATPFIPRRIGYELRSSQRYYQLKERCLMCDILKQELGEQSRTVDWDDAFAAFCPYASRVPYETWILPISHHAAFEEDISTWDRQLHFARFLKGVLRRLEVVSAAYHLVLHTCPNVTAKFEKTTNWQTIGEDFHWHFEILPAIPSKSKSYSVKEVYYNALKPEDAAQELRRIAVPV